MSRLFFPLVLIALAAISCGDEKKDKYFDGFDSITPEQAKNFITAYNDPRVPHDLDTIIKYISLNSKQFGLLVSKFSNVRLFTGAELVRYMPMIIIQGENSETSPVTYSYYKFSDPGGSICPPPQDCYSTIQVLTK